MTRNEKNHSSENNHITQLLYPDYFLYQADVILTLAC